MYLLNWNPDDQQIEACFGGRVSKGEAMVFCDDLRDTLEEFGQEPFTVVIDYSTASKMEQEVESLLETAREACINHGAGSVTFITRDEDEAERLRKSRIDEVLGGKERYIAFSTAA